MSWKFWGSKSKHYQVYALPVSSTVCLRAVKTRISPFGSLLARSTTFWSTNNHETYSCKWLKTKVNHFKHFTVTIYNGTLVGKDAFIHQSITRTTCFYKSYLVNLLSFQTLALFGSLAIITLTDSLTRFLSYPTVIRFCIDFRIKIWRSYSK